MSRVGTVLRCGRTKGSGPEITGKPYRHGCVGRAHSERDGSEVVVRGDSDGTHQSLEPRTCERKLCEGGDRLVPTLKPFREWKRFEHKEENILPPTVKR